MLSIVRSIVENHALPGVYNSLPILGSKHATLSPNFSIINMYTSTWVWQDVGAI